MHEIMSLIVRVAKTDSTCMVHGESGVGKDLIARHVHCYSRRASGPFVAVRATQAFERMSCTVQACTEGAFQMARCQTRSRPV